MIWWQWLILMLVVAASLWVDRQVNESWHTYDRTRLLFSELRQGCYYAQLFVLVTCAALLPGKPLLRWAVTGGLATIAWYFVAWNGFPYAERIGLVHWGIVAADVALLLVLRWRFGFHLRWPGEEPAAEHYQFSIGEMLVVTTIAAGLLWLGTRWLQPFWLARNDVQDAASSLIVHMPVHWLVAMPAMAVVWDMKWQHLPLTFVYGACYVNSVGALTLWGAKWIDLDLDFTEWCFFLAAQLLTVFIMFGLLRLLGFRSHWQHDGQGGRL